MPGKRITAMKKVCKYTHWEPVGKDNGAADYCQKEETRVEGPWTFGERPLNMTVSEDNLKRRKLKNEEIIKGNLKDLIDNDDIHISQLPLITKALEQYKKLNQTEAQDLEGTCGIWIYGPKGVGKSHHARHELGYTEEQILNKNINKWFNDWDSKKHQAVLLDDLDLSHSTLGHYLK